MVSNDEPRNLRPIARAGAPLHSRGTLVDQTSPPSQTMRGRKFSEDARINRLLSHIGYSLASGAILFEPNWLEFSTPAWTEHLPFASWLVSAHHPRCLVELGTHFANSYFGFCQSVAEQELATRCYAVDTWRGDAHSGQYDDGVFAAVNAHNEVTTPGSRRSYDARSTRRFLTSLTVRFILLHIDGLHTSRSCAARLRVVASEAVEPRDRSVSRYERPRARLRRPPLLVRTDRRVPSLRVPARPWAWCSRRRRVSRRAAREPVRGRNR